MRRRFPALVAAVIAAMVAVLIGPNTASAATWPVIANGDSGAQVTTVQHLLNHRGYATTADGQFGPATEAKVSAFQSANGLTADGSVGPLTWPKLVATVQSGSTGNAAKAAQTQLNRYGYGLVVDGDFGTASTNAAKDFQSKHGLTADGIVGPNTWNALVGGSGSGGGGGGTSRAQLAASIDASSRISLLTYHVSGVVDADSTAQANITDTKNGTTAETSNYSDVGEREVWLSTAMLNGMLKLATERGYTFLVTEIAGGDHSSNSNHYKGVAFDADNMSVSNATFVSACRAYGATEALDEGNHVHCAWQ
ncbi:peptidoglycan-binding domain-containing protein [Streptomyces hydrogenans]|uniref:peptidoglycan-binding domain-containing protein n=1 Tax=Streptomyces hydrogenans TaxID=1873719 RepID=UPI0035D8E0DA